MESLQNIWREAWRPPDRRPPWQWCEELIGAIPYSPMPGRFRSDNSPWVREVMEAIVDHRVRLVSILASIQSSKTTRKDCRFRICDCRLRMSRKQAPARLRTVTRQSAIGIPQSKILSIPLTSRLPPPPEAKSRVKALTISQFSHHKLSINLMKLRHLSLLAAGLLVASTASAALDIPTVFVGDAGNPNDGTGYGQVSYDYHIGTYEVTNAQYASFLNSVAATDTFGLYNTGMAGSHGGITRTGSSGSYSYTATNPNTPVNYVSFWDAARFTNWLTTGSTENGVYNLGSVTNPTNNTITRDETAWLAGGVAIASENEWYKAAYYSGSPTGADGDGYWLYPTQSNSAPSNGNPPGGTNSANYDDNPNTLTTVGAYVNSSSHYGTFDQGGNLWEWNDEIISTSARGVRGGSFNNLDNNLQSSDRDSNNPTTENKRQHRIPCLQPGGHSGTFACRRGDGSSGVLDGLAL